VKLLRGLFTSLTPHWATPKWLYEHLDKEFHFTDDPCPLHGTGGLDRKWGSVVYINPPYGREIGKWIKKAYDEAVDGSICVLLIPSRTDTKWWHDYIMKANEIRFIKGRLKFNDCKNPAPFPSAIVIFNRKDTL
jgi:hypothetical protein